MFFFHDRHAQWRPQLHPLTEVAVTAFVLGFLGCLSLVCIGSHLLGTGSVWTYAFGWYMLVVVVTFHFSEFVVAAQYRPHDASPRSFMIFHSKAFLIANGVAWAEFLVGGWLLDLSYHPTPTTLSVTLAAVLALGFYSVRVVAMVQCGSHFALMVEYSKRDSHRLVKTGVYSVLRHPSYFGWFWYAVATQLIAHNPVCLVLYAIATYVFFRERIRDEEELLESEAFFGNEYTEYKKRTYTGIPFIRSK
jgi:protein-S-isoprenylcysteine O-methyltransferase